MDIKSHLAEKLRILRRRKGWDQATLADKGKELKQKLSDNPKDTFSIGIIRDIESAKGNPTLDTLIILAQVLDCTISELIGDSNSEGSELGLIISTLLTLDKDQLGQASRFLSRLSSSSASSTGNKIG